MMDETRKIEEFERMLAGEGGLADDELAGLFLLARGMTANAEQTREAAPAMRPDFRAALRTQLLQQSQGAVPLGLHRRVRASVQARNARMRRSFRTVAAVAAATMVMLVGGAIVAAAQGTVRGDALYGVKVARENLALHATFGRLAHARRQLDLSRERLDEMKTLLDRRVGDAEPYIDTLEEMDARTLDATKDLIDAYRAHADSGALATLIDFSAAQRQGLEAIADTVPPGAQPKALSSIELVQAVQNRVSDVLGGCPCPSEVLTPAAAAKPGQPGAVVCSCTTPAKGSAGSSTGSATQPKAKPPVTNNTDNGNGTTSGEDQTGPLPQIDGTNVDDTVNQTVDGILNQLGVPTPTPSLPPLP